MTIRRRTRRTLLTVVTAIILAVSLVAGLAISNIWNPLHLWQKTISTGDQPKPIGESVEVSGDKVPADIKAEKATIPLPSDLDNPKLFQPLSPILKIGPSGLLQAPMTVTFALDAPVQKDDAVYLVTSESGESGTWTVIKATVTPDLMHVQITTDHLSFWEVVKSLASSALKLATDALLDIGNGAFSEASKPSCPNEPGARTDNYSISSSNKDTVFWCFGLDDAKGRVVRVVNNRRYPLEVTASDMPVLDPGSIHPTMAQAYALKHTVIMPRESMLFGINSLDEGAKATLDTAVSNWALGLGVLDIVSQAFLTIVIKTNSKQAQDLVEVAMLIPACYNSFDNFNVLNVIRSCFTEEILAKAIGPVAAFFLAPVALGFSLGDVTRAMSNALGDSKNSRAKYNITVTRNKPAPFASLAGKWQRHSSILNLGSDGTGKYISPIGASGCDERIPLGSSVFCYWNGELKLTDVAADGTASGTYTKVWYTENDHGSVTIVNYVPRLSASFPHVGDHITIKLDAQRSRIIFPDEPPPNNNMCGPNASVTDKRDCNI